MIIKIIPETEEEKNRMGEEEIEYNNVKEFFIFGNKEEDDKSIFDFHEWFGSFRYIMGNLKYFYEIVNDSRKEQNENGGIKAKIVQPAMVKKGVVSSIIQPIDVSKMDGKNQEE